MREQRRATYEEFSDRIHRFDFCRPHCIHQGTPLSVSRALQLLGEFGHHGALDPVEGAVWRVERNRQVHPGRSNVRRWEVHFLVKYVRPDKRDGCYLPEISGEAPVWNVS